ncbi:MAG: alpha/beta fold hydrolase [Zavarzinella sp.]
MVRSIFCFFVGCLISPGTFADEVKPVVQFQPTGLWLGTLKIGVIDLRIVLEITKEKEGKLSGQMISLDQGNAKVPFSSIEHTDNNLNIELKLAGINFKCEQVNATEMKADFKQGGVELKLKLQKIEKIPVSLRPQMPKPPFPYLVRELEFKNEEAKISLAGTLTLPDGKGPFPTVVLVSGSGPQDRDETLFGHKPFWVIADHFARNGIASFRYDERGVGKSKGKFAGSTSADFASDCLAAIQMLQKAEGVDPSKIGICGHSEGGLVAPLVASNNPKEVAFIISLAGPGITGEQILYTQMQDFALQLDPNAKDEIAQSRKMLEKLVPIMKSGEKPEIIEKNMTKALDEFITDLPVGEAKDSLTKGKATIIGRLADPWMCWFVSHDPTEFFKKTKCPVLALNGGKDVQVKPKDNLNGIKKALMAGKNSHFEIKEFPGLNHLFQECKSGQLNEYGLIEQTISPKVLDVMAQWILKR